MLRPPHSLLFIYLPSLCYVKVLILPEKYELLREYLYNKNNNINIITDNFWILAQSTSLALSSAIRLWGLSDLYEQNELPHHLRQLWTTTTKIPTSTFIIMLMCINKAFCVSSGRESTSQSRAVSLSQKLTWDRTRRFVWMLTLRCSLLLWMARRWKCCFGKNALNPKAVLFFGGSTQTVKTNEEREFNARMCTLGCWWIYINDFLVH